LLSSCLFNMDLKGCTRSLLDNGVSLLEDLFVKYGTFANEFKDIFVALK